MILNVFKVLIYAYSFFKCIITFFFYTYLSIRDHCLLFWKKISFNFYILYNIFLLAFLNSGFMLIIFFIRDRNTFGGKIIP